MNLPLVLLQQTLLSQIIMDASDQLPGPTLIYHDGTRDDEVSDVVKRLSPLREIILATMRPRRRPEPPSPPSLHLPRSTILLGRSPELMFQSLRTWRLWNARDPVLVILKAGSSAGPWISTAWHTARSVNITVVVLDSPVQFFTWFPFRSQHCTNSNTTNIVSKNRLFPPKVPENLKGCSFKAVTSLLRPLSFYDTQGIEPRIVLTLTEKLNLSLEFVQLPPDTFVWNYFNQSGDPILGMKLLWENKVDLLFCNAQWIYEQSLWVEFLPSHLEDYMSWLVPGPRILNPTTTIIRAFSATAWMFVSISCVAIYIASALLPYLETGIQTPALMRAIAFNLNLSISMPPSRVFRFFMMVTYFYSLHITTAYQSSLIIFLSEIPREPPITTPEELAESEYPVEFLTTNRFFVEGINKPYMAVLNQPHRRKWVHLLALFDVPLRKVAILGPKLSLSYYVDLDFNGKFRDKYGYPLALVLREPAAMMPLTMYMSLGHPLYPLSHHYSTYLIEGGFPDQFVRMETRTPGPISRERASFGLENVEGVFVLYLGLIGLSVLAFFSEVLLARGLGWHCNVMAAKQFLSGAKRNLLLKLCEIKCKK